MENKEKGQKKTAKQHQTIEQNFAEIESIITSMQEEDITLDQSFELYNKGIQLVKDCNAQIDTIEKKMITINEKQE